MRDLNLYFQESNFFFPFQLDYNPLTCDCHLQSLKAVHVCLNIVLLCWKGSRSHLLKVLPFQSLSLLIPFNHSDLADQSQHLLPSWATKEFHSPHATSQKHGGLKGSYSCHFSCFSVALPSPSLRPWGWRVCFHLKSIPPLGLTSLTEFLLKSTKSSLGFSWFSYMYHLHTHINKCEKRG